MATKTEEGAGAEVGTQARGDETTARTDTVEEGRAPGTTQAGERGAPAGDVERAEASTAAGDTGIGDADAEDEDDAEDHALDTRATEGKAPSGVGLGAGAVVSAALGLVSLSGGWIGTVAGARQQLVGQLRTSSTAGVATQIKAVYGDSWHTTALWAGLFALAALVTGVVVLVRPAFGAPGRPQVPWIKSVAWAGVSLGVIGLLLAVLKYSDALLALPSAG
ncbi:hypothetical protein [Streptomyces sp. NPDC051452]|uniref:hypothetical protein n=1 Tax=Streptomyces sp. NPDC051452 TaxID=3365654 RepID=UPI0037BAC458